MADKKCECTVEKCDIFDFMALHVGLTVIHPGGLKATAALAEGLKIGPDSRVCDIGCGKGTGAVFLADRYGCKVSGIDLYPELIEQANSLARRKELSVSWYIVCIMTHGRLGCPSSLPQAFRSCTLPRMLASFRTRFFRR